MNPFKWFKRLFQPAPPFKVGYDMASKALLNCLPEDELQVLARLNQLCLYKHCCDAEDSEYYDGINQAVREWCGDE